MTRQDKKIKGDKPNFNLTEKFAHLGELKEGNPVSIHLYKEVKTSKPVVIKEIFLPIDYQETRKYDDKVSREISILSLLKEKQNSQVVEFLDFTFSNNYDSTTLHLVFEMMDYDLREHLRRCEVLDQKDAHFLMKQLLDGVAFLQSMRIAHRDLKPTNLLIDQRTRKLKITDFGVSRFDFKGDRNYTLQIQTAPYKAPEIFLGMKDYKINVDMWSVGVIFVELRMGGECLFGGQVQTQIFDKIMLTLGFPTNNDKYPLYDEVNFKNDLKNRERNTLPECYKGDELKFIHRMLEYDVGVRISANEAKRAFENLELL